MIPSFTAAQVGAWRMGRCLDLGPAPDAVAVAERLAGVQAQVTSSAEQAVAVRGAAPGAVGDALAARTLMRTWAQRGTLHLLPVATAGSYLSLLAAPRTWEKGSWQRTFATAAQVAELTEAAAAVLDGVELTRAELASAILDRTRDESLRELLGSGWGAVLKPLAWQGVLCNGDAPADAGRVTFTSPATRFPGWSGLPDPDVAAATVIPAYLGAHGPATPAAFDQWLLRGGTRRAVLTQWFADLVEAGELTAVDVDGDRRYARAADLDALADAHPTGRVALLPAFDQVLLGPGTADPDVLDPARRAQVSKAAGWIAPVVVRDGRVVGVWAFDGDDVAVTVFDEAGPIDGLADAVAALGAALQRDLRLTGSTGASAGTPRSST
ncbi:DNA glycosylase AlkZ-like family protein [Pseudonocardia sp. CA-107938]|uniref:DNA glycosylase AlkZ-like family protein n=1 Tax=Pseudonocardia sp. CA-107938 TaxID=3240021 RepID=UPI003D8E6204